MDCSIEALHQSHADESVLEKMRSLVCKKNKARFRTALIGSTMVGLTVLLNRVPLSESLESGDRHRSDLPIQITEY